MIDPETPRLPAAIRLIDTRYANNIVTDIYQVGDNSHRQGYVTRQLFGDNGTIIELSGQSRRMWDGAGREYHKKGYRAPPPPMTVEEAETLNLLFKALRITPPLPGAGKL